jgi:hypothetical protein
MILPLGQEHNLRIHYFCSRSGQENLERIGLCSAFTLDRASVLRVPSHSPMVEVGEMENYLIFPLSPSDLVNILSLQITGRPA